MPYLTHLDSASRRRLATQVFNFALLARALKTTCLTLGDAIMTGTETEVDSANFLAALDVLEKEAGELRERLAAK